MRTPVSTELGEFNGRDAIHLERTLHTVAPSRLTFEGEFNAALCNRYHGRAEWIAYALRFEKVTAYSCWHIDRYPSELEICSSFDIVNESAWIKGLGLTGLTHYVLATYDYIYEIAASGFELEVKGER